MNARTKKFALWALIAAGAFVAWRKSRVRALPRMRTATAAPPGSGI